MCLIFCKSTEATALNVVIQMFGKVWTNSKYEWLKIRDKRMFKNNLPKKQVPKPSKATEEERSIGHYWLDILLEYI